MTVGPIMSSHNFISSILLYIFIINYFCVILFLFKLY